MAELLRVESLAKRFGGIVATDNLTLSVAEGELHAVIGPNGAGKTTLIAQLSGQLVPDSGRVYFGGGDITGVSMPARSRLGLARSFQITSLFLDLSVLDNVALAVRRTPVTRFTSGPMLATSRNCAIRPALRSRASA